MPLHINDMGQKEVNLEEGRKISPSFARVEMPARESSGLSGEVAFAGGGVADAVKYASRQRDQSGGQKAMLAARGEQLAGR